MNNIIKEVMRENAHRLVSELIEQGVAFRLIIWNNDDWNLPLPDDVMKKFPKQLILDLKEHSLETSEVIEGIIYLNASFDSEDEWSKELIPEDIVGILDFDGQPFQINSFYPDEILPDIIRDELFPKTKDDIVEFLEEYGIEKKDAIRSINVFLKK